MSAFEVDRTLVALRLTGMSTPTAELWLWKLQSTVMPFPTVRRILVALNTMIFNYDSSWEPQRLPGVR